MGQAAPFFPDHRHNPAMFYIGQDSHGNWIARDERGTSGGIFVDRAEAFRFALFENGHRPRAVTFVPGVFELEVDDGSSVPTNNCVNTWHN